MKRERDERARGGIDGEAKGGKFRHGGMDMGGRGSIDQEKGAYRVRCRR